MKEALAARDNRPLWHLLAVLVILLAASALFYRSFLSGGTLMHVDMTYPTTIDRNLALYSNTWWQYGSVQNIWNCQRVLWAYPLLAFVKLFHISTDAYLVMLFMGTLFLAGVSMYTLAYHKAREWRLDATRTWAPFAVGVFAALIYMYNPWSLSHLWPYFGYPAYAVLPLVWLLLVKAVKDPRPAYVIGLAVITSVASTGPICVLWFWLLIVAYMLFHLIARRFSRESLLKVAKVLVPTAALYLLLGAMWLLPYLFAQFSNKPFQPVYSPVMSQSMLDLLSSGSSIANNVRFASGWGMPVNPQVGGAFWGALSFALPVVAVVSLIALRRKVRRDATVVFLGIVTVIALALATGSSSFLRAPYSYLVLRMPGASLFGWLVRASDRWLFYVPLFYSLMAGLLLGALLRGERSLVKARKAIAAAMAVLVLLSFGPIVVGYAKYVFDPTHIPGDYEEVNAYTEDVSPGARPAWLPFSRDGFNYTWAPDKRVGAFSVYSSNPNLNNLQDLFAKDSWYKFTESMLSDLPTTPIASKGSDTMTESIMLDRSVMVDRSDLTARLLVPFAARLMIFDRSAHYTPFGDFASPERRFGETFEKDRSLSPDRKTGLLDVYSLSGRAAYIRPVTDTIAADSLYDDLAFSQALPPDRLDRVAFLNDGPPLEGHGVQTVTAHEKVLNRDPGFVEWGLAGASSGWTLVDAGPRVKVSAERAGPPDLWSLRVENDRGSSTDTVWVIGDGVPVRPGSICSFAATIRYRNSTWTHAAVEGFLPSTGEWKKLVYCPVLQPGGTRARWRTWRCSFYVPPGVARLRPALAAGWQADRDRGPAVTWFTGARLSIVDPAFVGGLGASSAPEVTWVTENAHSHRVSVRGASSPFVLAFSEAFDPLWTARYDDGTVVEPVKLYGTITGFPVDRKGSFSMTIEYPPQRWFVTGLWVSLSVLLLSLCYLGYLARRRLKKGASG